MGFQCLLLYILYSLVYTLDNLLNLCLTQYCPFLEGTNIPYLRVGFRFFLCESSDHIVTCNKPTNDLRVCSFLTLRCMLYFQNHKLFISIGTSRYSMPSVCISNPHFFQTNRVVLLGRCHICLQQETLVRNKLRLWRR